MTNLGDVAMVQVAVRRLAHLWPHARIEVFADQQDLLMKHCPEATAVLTDGRTEWFRGRSVLFGGRVSRVLPGRVSRRMGVAEARLRRRWPHLAARVIRTSKRLRGADTDTLSVFLDALRDADLFVVSGAGVITSSFEILASDVLELLRIAMSWDASTVLFGQGLGPFRTSTLWLRGKNILPHVDMICLREKRRGRPLLDGMGVDPGRVCITGDDAIELAFDQRRSTLGQGIGVNLRRASYSAVDDRLAEGIGSVLRTVAMRNGVPLVPVPVYVRGIDSDVETIRTVLQGHSCGAEWEAIDSPEQLIRQIGRCRVVVTGSYHGAVFAMAQGIPAVGLAKSEYYIDKFLGLADQFGGGCETVELQEAGLAERLSAAIERIWTRATALRPLLLSAAADQIAASRLAYQRVYEMVEGRRQGSQRNVHAYSRSLLAKTSNSSSQARR